MTTYSTEGGITQGMPEMLPPPQETGHEPITAEPSVEQLGEITTSAVLRVERMAAMIGTAIGKSSSWRARRLARRIPAAVDMLPLIEEAHANGFTSRDVAKNRDDILEVAGYGYAAKAARIAEKLHVQAPGQHLEEKIIDVITSKDTEKLITDARRKVESAATEVEFMAGFDDPRQAFLDEVDIVATKVGDAIIREQATRIELGGGRVTAPHDTPPGILGLATKIIRKIKSFFGFFRRAKPQAEKVITAYDAAAGMQKSFESLMSDKDALRKDTPMLKRYLFDRLPAGKDAKQWQLAMAAPELLEFLFSTAPDKPQNRYLASQVRQHPHELYFATKYIRHLDIKFGKQPLRLDLDHLRTIATTALPALSEVLPTSGQAIRETYRNVLNLMQILHYIPEQETELEDDPDTGSTKLKTLRDRTRTKIHAGIASLMRNAKE